MNRIKCRNCGLVDVANESYCRRCGAAHYGAGRIKGQGPLKASKRKIPWLPIAGLAIAAFAAYSYLGQKGADTTSANTVNRQISTPQPQPTLSLRAEHEQRQTGSFKTAIQNSPGIAESQKRLEETQKLMRTEPAKPQR